MGWCDLMKVVFSGPCFERDTLIWLDFLVLVQHFLLLKMDMVMLCYSGYTYTYKHHNKTLKVYKLKQNRLNVEAMMDGIRFHWSCPHKSSNNNNIKKTITVVYVWNMSLYAPMVLTLSSVSRDSGEVGSSLWELLLSSLSMGLAGLRIISCSFSFCIAA